MFSASTKRGKEITKNIYYFSENQGLDCNIYVIVDPETNEIALFDAGNGVSLNGLFEGMKNLGLDYNDITRVFMTHEHVDHVLGLYPLMKALKDEPPEIFAYGETAKILSEGDVSQIFPGNLGITPQMFGVEVIPLKVKDIEGTSEVTFSDYVFQVHYTPGHSLGSICYYDTSKKILIPGDLVFSGGNFGRFDFPGGSLKQLQESIKHVNDLDVNILLPGHMGIAVDNANKQIASSNRMVQFY